MGQKTPVSSKANLVISLVLAAAAVSYFVFGPSPSPTDPQPGASTPQNATIGSASNRESAPERRAEQKEQTALLPNAAGTPVVPPTPDRPFSHPVPYEVIPPQPALSAEAASSLAAELSMQVQTDPNDLPEDLKAQLHAAPPELPEDLRKQLNAPPPEIPDDIKAQMAIPPRRVSIDEVNDPNFIQKQEEPKAP